MGRMLTEVDYKIGNKSCFHLKEMEWIFCEMKGLITGRE